MCYFDRSPKLVNKECAVHYPCRENSILAVKKLKVQFYCKHFFDFPLQMFLSMGHNTNSVDLDIELIL